MVNVCLDYFDDSSSQIKRNYCIDAQKEYVYYSYMRHFFTSSGDQLAKTEMEIMKLELRWKGEREREREGGKEEGRNQEYSFSHLKSDF